MQWWSWDETRSNVVPSLFRVGRGHVLPTIFSQGSRQNCAISVVGPRPGMASLLNFAFSPEPCHLRSCLTLRILFLAVLELVSALGIFLEESLYKRSICMN